MVIEERFCCDLMENFLEKTEGIGYSTKVEVSYSQLLREYYIGSSYRQSVFFCPWCGNHLPGSLRNEYKNILNKEHSIEVDIYTALENGKFRIKTDDEIINTNHLPEEFKSDEWWKKRGL